ncbi:MAG: Sensor protein RstB [Planctomycetota bacterium]
MIRLFIKFAAIVALVFLAGRWTFYRLLEGQVFSDRQRVVAGLSEVHLGGMRLIATELATGDPQQRKDDLGAMQKDLVSPLEIRSSRELNAQERWQLDQRNGFVCLYRDEIIDYLGVRIDSESYLRLGPIAEKTNEFIEDETVGWLRMLSRKMALTNDPDALLARFSSEFGVQARLLQRDSIPLEAQQRLAMDNPTLFYDSSGEYFVSMLLQDRNEVVNVGPLLKVKKLAERTMTKAMIIWFLIVLGAAGWLVYNVSNKFRSIELAAKKIAQGNFGARVDESNAGESKILASAFNAMAIKTENSIRSKKELLQAISHELRTPLSRIRFAVELLNTSKDPELKESRMSVVRQSIDNLDEIVGEVLAYVQNEDDSPAKKLEWIEIQPGLIPMLKLFEAEYPHLKFEWVYPGPIVCTDLYADRIIFHRVLRNLLSNAVRYAKTTVRIHIFQSEQQNVCVQIEDDGPGIPEQHRNEILKPFFRLETESPRESAVAYTGLGLGLAIVDRSLKQHGGTVSIQRGTLGGCLISTSWPLPVEESVSNDSA